MCSDVEGVQCTMRKIEVEEAHVTVFGVHVGTLHASGSGHLTDRYVAED